MASASAAAMSASTLWPGEVLAVVGESGSGKSTLLKCLSMQLSPSSGRVTTGCATGRCATSIGLSEAERRFLMRTDWGFVHQDPREGLRMGVSAGANIGERLMAVGERHYGRISGAALDWMERVEIAGDRIDDSPNAYSGGMRQRLQIARNLVTAPRLVFMDEPTGGLDVSVQARLLDLMRRLTHELGPVGGRRHPRSRSGAAFVQPDDGDAGGAGHRERPDRPGSGGSAGALYAAAGVLGAAGLTMATLLEISRLSKTFRLHIQGGVEIPVFDRLDLVLGAARCWR